MVQSAQTTCQYNVDEMVQSAQSTCQCNVDEMVQSAQSTCQCSVPLCPLYSPEKDSYSVFTNRSDLLSVRIGWKQRNRRPYYQMHFLSLYCRFHVVVNTRNSLISEVLKRDMINFDNSLLTCGYS